MPRHPWLFAPILLLVTGCASSDPMRLIPPTDRSMLEAEARMGTGGGTSGRPISVDQMLASARGAAAPGRAPEPVVLRFAADAVQPDPAQRMTIEGFAQRAAGAPRVIVVGRRASGATAEAMLSQRRAVAVARLLEPRFPEVELRFEPTAVADEIILLGGAPPR